jgi:Glyoxalase-like domain
VTLTTFGTVVRAAYKDLCLDAVELDPVSTFWAAALGREVERRGDNEALIRDPVLNALWINVVPESKTVKNRVHLDLYAPSPQRLLDLGATPYDDQGRFLVMRDPGGNELCVFPGHAAGAVVRPFALCVDSAHPVEAARWWHGLLGGRIGNGPDRNPRWLYDGAGCGELIMKFVPVDDERVVKNRCHWDVTTDDVDRLVAAGATVVRAQDDDIKWTVLADPEGNEFCAFTT